MPIRHENILASRRFLPLFLTQFLGAFNDNVFKNSVALLVAFEATTQAESGLLINLAAGLFILPFALFSPVAGTMSDKYDKAKVLKTTKLSEIVVMSIAAVGLYTHSTPLLMLTIFLMGTQSAFFGPAKYAILPEHLKEDELTNGNSFISMSTFIAIILGVIASSVLVKDQYRYLLPVVVLVLAAAGYVAALKIPKSNVSDASLKLNWNFVADIKSVFGFASEQRSVFLSILGISWLWGIGSAIITQIPNVAKFALHSNEDMSVALTVAFVVGISVGALLCMWLSRREIELGLVPLGALGMTVFGLAFSMWQNAAPGGEQTVTTFLAAGGHNWWLFVSLALTGASCSLYVIPLNALVQARADEKSRSRVIAANNIMNAVFMVAAAVVGILLFKINFDTMALLMWFFIVNIVVAIYIFATVPEFVMRFIVWILANSIYTLRYEGRDHIPRHGAAVIVANHVSFIDWFILTAACRRPVHFIVYHKIYNAPVLKWLFQLSKAIPIAPAKEDAKCKEEAFQRSKKILAEGKLLCIFPEGMITHDGELNPFKPGVEAILAEQPAPVVPIALKGLWGSFFSRKGGAAMGKLPKPSRRKIEILVGDLLPPATKATDMQTVITRLLGGAT